jgi:hypothetical protein
MSFPENGQLTKTAVSRKKSLVCAGTDTKWRMPSPAMVSVPGSVVVGSGMGRVSRARHTRYTAPTVAALTGVLCRLCFLRRRFSVRI